MNLWRLRYVFETQYYLKDHIIAWSRAEDLNIDDLLRKREKVFISGFLQKLVDELQRLNQRCHLDRIIRNQQTNVSTSTILRRIYAKDRQRFLNVLAELASEVEMATLSTNHAELDNHADDYPASSNDSEVMVVDLTEAIALQEVVIGDDHPMEEVVELPPSRFYNSPPAPIQLERLKEPPVAGILKEDLGQAEQMIPHPRLLVQHLNANSIRSLLLDPPRYHATKEELVDLYLIQVFQHTACNLPVNLQRYMQTTAANVHVINMYKTALLIYRLQGFDADNKLEFVRVMADIIDTVTREGILQLPPNTEFMASLQHHLQAGAQYVEHDYARFVSQTAQSHINVSVHQPADSQPLTSDVGMPAPLHPEVEDVTAVFDLSPPSTPVFSAHRSSQDVTMAREDGLQPVAAQAPLLNVATLDMASANAGTWKQVISDVRCINNDGEKQSQARYLLIDKLMATAELRLLNLHQLLYRLGVENIQTAKNRQLQQLRGYLAEHERLSSLYDQIMQQVRKAKQDTIAKVVHVTSTLNNTGIWNLYASLTRKLNMQQGDRAGRNLRQLCRQMMLDNLHNEEVLATFTSVAFANVDLDNSEHRCFAPLPNAGVQEKLDQHRRIMEHFHATGDYIVQDNPVIDACAEFHQKVQDEIQLSQTSCTNCHARDIGLAVINGVCDLCSSPTRFRNFGARNNMDPGDQPDELKGLTPAEVAAISLILPVITVYRKGDGVRMKGHSISFPQDLQETVTRLPRLPDDLSLVYLASPAPQSTRVLKVRRQRILVALTWLKQHNRYYRDIQISDEALGEYPVDGNIQVPGFELPEDAHVGVDDGPTTGNDEASEARHHATMRLPDILATTTERERFVQQIRARVEQPQGATEANPLDWPEQGLPTGERAPGFWPKAFPTLFCHGVAGHNDPRPHRVSREEWVRHLMRHDSGRFAADTRFVFFVFAFLQKEKAWTLGNMYAASNALTTKADLVRRLHGSEDELRDLVKTIVKTTSKISGTNQYMKQIGKYAYSFVNHYRHHSNDTENFNIFYTVSSADFHWPDFYQMFPEGRAHLAKTLVSKEEDIPGGADRQAYVTSSEDHLWRRNFLMAKAHHYDLYFRKKLDLLLKHVLVPVFGVKDSIIRYEYQSRGAIHAHILLAVPMGINETERLRIWAITKDQEFFDLRSELQHSVFVDHAQIPAELPDHMTPNERAIYSEMRILIEVALRLGVTECHPSRDSRNWFIMDNGSLVNPPPSAVLRQSFDDTLQQASTSLTNIVNKVGIHRCSRTYCCLPRRVVRQSSQGVEEEVEVESECRFGYPRKLIGYRFVQENNEIVRVDRSDTPQAPGLMEKDRISGHPVVRLQRNHQRCISYCLPLLLAMPCNQDMQYVCKLSHLVHYILKYISKPESDSQAAIDYCKQLVEDMDDGDLVRKLCQKLIQRATKEHDYTLAEVHLYLNKCDAIVFSRPIVVLPALNDKQLDLAVGDAEPVLRQSLGEIYDARLTDDNYRALVEAFEQAQAGDLHLPCAKHPGMVSLYEFASMFSRTWTPMPMFSIVHVLPPFKHRPDPESPNNWFRKFLLTLIRAHYVPDVPRLEDLELYTNDELWDMGEEFFLSELAPIWAKDLWFDDRSMVTAEDVLPLFAPVQEVQPDEDNAIADDLLQDIDALAAVGIPEPDPAVDGADEVNRDDEYDDNWASVDYDRFKDKTDLGLDDWTRDSPARFRHEVIRDEVNTVDDGDVLPHNQLNAEQQRAVAYLMDKTMSVMADPEENFFLEICGSAGTGKTTILKRFKEDLRNELADNPRHAVGRLLHFAAATGAAAKMLPTPNSTLHKLFNLPIGQDSKKPLDALTPGTLAILQDNLAGARVIIIDEKSFVGCRMLYDIDQRLREINVSPDRPFGGLSVVLLGDFKQLCPVGDRALYATPNRQRWPVYQQYGRDVYTDNFRDVIVLKENQRQINDPDFQRVIRDFLTADKELSLQSWDILSTRQFDQLSEAEQREFDQNAVYLCALKKAYKERNLRKICDLENPRVLVQATNQPPGGTRFDSNKAGGLPNQLLLTRGMRVMLTANLDLSNGLSNGSTGTILGIIYFTEQDTIPTVIVQFDGYTGRSCLDLHAQAYPVSRIERTWSHGKTRYTRLMLPLLPAYGFSIHKSQGQTLDKVVINLGAKDFAAGLTYTALTRARGLKSMAFHPMPTMDRLNSVIKSKSFKEQKADDAKKAGMDEELRQRQN